MLLVAPGALVLLEDLLRDRGELRALLHARALGQGIAALPRNSPELGCDFPRLCEACRRNAAEAYVTAAAVNDDTQQPALGAGRLDFEIETIAVGIASRCPEIAHGDG